MQGTGATENTMCANKRWRREVRVLVSLWRVLVGVRVRTTSAMRKGCCAMKLMVDVSGIQFTVGRPWAPRTDQNGVQKTEKGTGRPLHVVQLVAIDETGAETINVTVAVENPPRLTQGQSVRPESLEAIPWVKNNTNAAQVAFRATAVVPVGVAKAPTP